VRDRGRRKSRNGLKLVIQRLVARVSGPPWYSFANYAFKWRDPPDASAAPRSMAAVNTLVGLCDHPHNGGSLGEPTPDRRRRLLVYLLQQPREIVDAGRVGVTHQDEP
jgi:hypothetical protein